MRRTAFTLVATLTVLTLTATAASAVTFTRDTSFGGGDGVSALQVAGNDFAFDVVVDDDGYYLVGGTRKNKDAACSFMVARYQLDGRLDRSWANEGVRRIAVGSSGCATSATLTSDGGLLVAGWSTVETGSASVVALTPGGALDTSFSVDGKQHIRERQGISNPQVQVEPDGTIWLGWAQIRNWDTYVGNYRVAHLRPSGAVDRNFGQRGVRTYDLEEIDYVRTSAIDSSGRFYLLGWSARSLRASGTAGVISVNDGERSYTRTLNAWPTGGTFVISADTDDADRLVLGLTPYERSGWGAARLQSDLTLDRTYGTDGFARHQCDCFSDTGTLTPGGLVLVGTTRTRTDRTLVARFDSDGRWDAEAAQSGPWALSDRWEQWNAAEVDALGRIVLGGQVGSRDGDAAIARLTVP